MLDIFANWIARFVMWVRGDWQPDGTALTILGVLLVIGICLFWLIWKSMTRPIVQLSPMPPPPIEQPIPWIAIMLLLTVLCGVVSVIWFMPRV